MGYNKMIKERLIELINEKSWSVLKNIPTDTIIALLDYQDCMFLAYDLFFQNSQDDECQDAAVRLFISIRDHFSEAWNADWKNDVLLGQLCGLTWRYNERYDCYKRAYNRLDDPPEYLLLLLSGCNNAPGIPPMTDQDSEMYLKQALDKKMSFEAAIKMRGIARSKQNSELELYWDKKCQELEHNNVHTDTCIPDIFQRRKF